MRRATKMRVLVIGDGKVGHTLVEHLAQEGHDVVIVDSVMPHMDAIELIKRVSADALVFPAFSVTVTSESSCHS